MHVYDESAYYKVAQPKRAVEHTRTMSAQQIFGSMDVANRALQSAAENYAINDLVAIMNAGSIYTHTHLIVNLKKINFLIYGLYLSQCWISAISIPLIA